MGSKQRDFVFKSEQTEYALCSKSTVKPGFKDEARSSNWKPEDWENRSCALLKVTQLWVIMGKSQWVCALDGKGMVITKLLTELSYLNQLTDPSGMSPAETSFAGEAESWIAPPI